MSNGKEEKGSSGPEISMGVAEEKPKASKDIGEMKYEEYLCKLETAAKGGMLDVEYNKEKQNLDYIGKHYAKTEEIRLKTQASRQALERAYLEIKAKYGESANKSQGKSEPGHGKSSSLTKICPVCGTEYAEGYNFCVKKQCAAEGKSSELIYAWKCKDCGADLAESITRHGAIKHCPDCGAKLPEKQSEAINKNAAKPAKEENPGRYCRKCNKKYTGNEEICTKCGSLLAELKCGKCGSKYIKGQSGKYNKYCPECGNATIFAEKKPPKSEPKPEEKPDAKEYSKLLKWPVIITAAMLLCIGTGIFIGNKASNDNAQKIAQLEREKAEAEQKAAAEAEQRKKAEQEASEQNKKAEQEIAQLEKDKAEAEQKAAAEKEQRKKAEQDAAAEEERKKQEKEQEERKREPSATELSIRADKKYEAKEYSDALDLYLQAYEKGYRGDENRIGYMYREGQGVSYDYEEAVKWYRKSAEQGNAAAQSNLGYMYYKGWGVSRDYYEAVKWYTKAAEQGHASAQFNLGVMYEKGYGVTKSYYEAVKWYTKAAEQGDDDAQFNLGAMYYNGYGVSRNYYEAAKWFRKAADQGNEFAQDMLKRLGY